METETNTQPDTIVLQESLTLPGHVVIAVCEGRKPRTLAVLSKAQLQEVVQQAYDVHDLLADPLAREHQCGRDMDPFCSGCVCAAGDAGVRL